MTVKIDGTNTVANPAFTGADTDTGLQCGTDELKLVTGGTAQATVDSSGNFGIGTTSPSTTLHVRGSGDTDAASNSGSVRIQGGASLYSGYIGFDSEKMSIGHGNNNRGLSFAAGGSEAARFDSSGRLLVGTPSSVRDNALFQIKDDTGQTEVWLEHDNLGNDEFSRYIAVDPTANRSGQVGIYKHASIANPTGFAYLQCNDGADRWYWTDNSDVLRSSGAVGHIGTSNGSIVGTQTSDLRLKNVGANVAYGLAEVKQLQPKQYALKDDPDVNKLGFIAQEVESIIPESVYDTGEELDGHQEGDRTKLGMEYVQLIPVLVNAIKELSAEVDTLKTKVATLEAAE